MIEDKRNIDFKKNSNKSFGFLFFIIFFSLGIIPISNYIYLNSLMILISFVILCITIKNPDKLGQLNILWNKIGLLIGSVISPIIMVLIFLLVVWPTNLIMKISGKRLIEDTIDKKKNSYWITRADPNHSMKDQF
jgi:hypothetical protein